MLKVFALLLCAASPVCAATVQYNPDLMMVEGEDGRVMFRPIDGVDVHEGKYKAVFFPKPLPMCMFYRPSLNTVLGGEYSDPVFIKPSSVSYTPHSPIWGSVSSPPVYVHYPPHVQPEVSPVPLPWSGLMMAFSLAALALSRGRKCAQV